MTKKVKIGNPFIGGGERVAVQSMTNIKTEKIDEVVSQINLLADNGCDIVRLAVKDEKDAIALKSIKSRVQVPLVADIHFDYRLAIKSIENGVDKVRINPGNIGKREHTIKVVEAAKAHNVPIRIGINAGSLEKEFAEMDIPLHEKMIKSALRHIEILEDLNLSF